MILTNCYLLGLEGTYIFLKEFLMFFEYCGCISKTKKKNNLT